ncbi:MAG: hypothetical protein KDD25_04600 [Bdellovibrionales bacterium]|nr:hypothetical protein [Bdellovibrionales bacterium]
MRTKVLSVFFLLALLLAPFQNCGKLGGNEIGLKSFSGVGFNPKNFGGSDGSHQFDYGTDTGNPDVGPYYAGGMNTVLICGSLLNCSRIDSYESCRLAFGTLEAINAISMYQFSSVNEVSQKIMSGEIIWSRESATSCQNEILNRLEDCETNESGTANSELNEVLGLLGAVQSCGRIFETTYY